MFVSEIRHAIVIAGNVLAAVLPNIPGGARMTAITVITSAYAIAEALAGALKHAASTRAIAEGTATIRGGA